MNVLEILKWKGKTGVSDSEMINACQAMVPDLEQTEGFISQTLYKDANGFWVDIYYWDTSENAHLSNERMADKDSLKNLIELIEVDTISMEVLDPLQALK